MRAATLPVWMLQLASATNNKLYLIAGSKLLVYEE